MGLNRLGELAAKDRHDPWTRGQQLHAGFAEERAPFALHVGEIPELFADPFAGGASLEKDAGAISCNEQEGRSVGLWHAGRDEYVDGARHKPYRIPVRNLLLALLLITGTVWFWSLRRASVLFTLRIRGGRVVSSRGSLPPRLFSELVDIIERAGFVHGRVRAVVRDGAPTLLFEGELSPALSQQMRNVVGQFTVEQIRGGTRR